MASRQIIRNRIIEEAIKDLIDKIITLQEVEFIIELTINYLINNQHVPVKHVLVEVEPAGCTVKIQANL